MKSGNKRKSSPPPEPPPPPQSKKRNTSVGFGGKATEERLKNIKLHQESGSWRQYRSISIEHNLVAKDWTFMIQLLKLLGNCSWLHLVWLTKTEEDVYGIY